MLEDNNVSKQDTSNEYWAAQDTRTCADEVLNRVDDYYGACQANGWFSLWRRLYYAYNPNRYTLGQTIQSGEENEYRTIRVNHFRNILEHIQTLSITDRPVWQAQSTNSDSRSQKQTIVAESILDYYMREKRVERHLKDATRNALLFSEGFVSEWWEPTAGEKLARDQDTGQELSEGDLRYMSHEPVDIIRDLNMKNFNQRMWVVIRTYENKYEVAAKYPEYRDEITSVPYQVDARNHYLGNRFMDKSLESDVIPILNFYHVRCASVPEGRQMVMLQDGTVLTDTVLLYEHLPLQRIVPNEQIGVAMGMSVSADLLPLQEMLDAHYTAILSINENYGIPKILMPIGSNVQPDTMNSGFQVITYNPQAGKPEVMMMPMAPDGYFKTMQQIQQDMETLSGVNSVSRGNPEASLKSGSALALVQSMAIQFHSSLQQSYVQLLEDVGTTTIQILKEYADAPRIIQIAGLRNKGIIQQSFSKSDIDSISRVQVQTGNPLSKTVSGRLTIAQELLSNKMITNYQEYMMVLETGQLEPLTQGATSELLNLASENELLLDGKTVYTAFTDNHQLHITEHAALMSDPAIRTDPNMMAHIGQHINEHIQFLVDPQYQNFRQLMNYPSLQPAPQPGMPTQGSQMPQQGPSATQLNASSLPQNPAVQNQAPMGNPQVQQMANNVNMPNSPRNALTGQRAPLAKPI